LGAQVLAISVDHLWAHKAWAGSLGGIPFPLLADWSKDVTRRYGVLDEKRGTARRSVFVVDANGILRYKNLQFDARKTEDFDAAMAALEQA
jgi:alkyl hydroperoxide reductase subunit AhpC